jgi:hypothetical protein
MKELNKNEIPNQLIAEGILAPIEVDTPARVRIFLRHDSLMCNIYDCGGKITLHNHLDSWKCYVQKLENLRNVIEAALPKIEEIGKQYDKVQAKKRKAYQVSNKKKISNSKKDKEYLLNEICEVDSYPVFVDCLLMVKKSGIDMNLLLEKISNDVIEYAEVQFEKQKPVKSEQLSA